MIGDLLTFKASDGIELVGLLCLPKKKTRTALVCVHGMTGSLNDYVIRQLYPVAIKLGIAFFPFNNRGAAMVDSLDKWKGRKKTHKLGGTSFERFEDCIKDIDGALSVLRKRGFTKFILSGHSTGCQKIAYYQSRKNNPAVKGIILLAPADDLNAKKKEIKGRFAASLKLAKKLIRQNKGNIIMPKEYSHSMFSAKRYYDIFKAGSTEGSLFNYAKPLRTMPKIQCPVLAVFGKKEQYAVIPPVMMLEKIKNANPDSEVSLIPGNHSFRGGEKQLQARVRGWLAKNI